MGEKADRDQFAHGTDKGFMHAWKAMLPDRQWATTTFVLQRLPSAYANWTV